MFYKLICLCHFHGPPEVHGPPKAHGSPKLHGPQGHFPLCPPLSVALPKGPTSAEAQGRAIFLVFK